MTDDPMRGRRSDDQMKEVFHRLDRQDEGSRKLDLELREAKSLMDMLKLEIKHQAEMLGNRFTIIEKEHALTHAKLENIGKEIVSMGSDASNTPAGRAMNASHLKLESDVQSLADTVDKLVLWQNGASTLLSLVKWIGLSTLITLVWQLLRAFRVVPT